MNRIVCVGNRYRPEDCAGPLVYDYLQTVPCPLEVEIVDGGLGGLDLLRFAEAAERVVFVDAVSGLGTGPRIVVLTGEEVARAGGEVHDHAAGLSYLLNVLLRVSDEPPREAYVVGIQGRADGETVAAAGELCLCMARFGYPNVCRSDAQVSGAVS